MTTAARAAAPAFDERLKHEMKRLIDLQKLISSLNTSNVQQISEAILSDPSLFSEDYISTLTNTIVWVGYACYDETAAFELVRLLLRNQAFKDSIWTSLLTPCAPIVLKTRAEFIRRAVDSGILSVADAIPALKKNLGGEPVTLCAMLLALAPEIEASDWQLFEALKKHLNSENGSVVKEFALARDMFNDELREDNWKLYREFWKGEYVDAFEDVFAEDDVEYLNKLVSEGCLDKGYKVRSNWLKGEMRLADLAFEKKATKCVAFLCNFVGDNKLPLAAAKNEEFAMNLVEMTKDASSILAGAILYHRNTMAKKLLLFQGSKWNVKSDEVGAAKLLEAAVSANNVEAMVMLLDTGIEPNGEMQSSELRKAAMYKHTPMLWYMAQRNAATETGRGINQQIFAALVDLGDEMHAQLVLTIDPSVQLYRQLALTIAAKGLWKLAVACLSQGKLDAYLARLLCEGLVASDNVNISPDMARAMTTCEPKLPPSAISVVVRLAVRRHEVDTLSEILKAYQVLQVPGVCFSFIESCFL